jgi:uncharacterized membrane protein YqaE (UPF0057 family)
LTKYIGIWNIVCAIFFLTIELFDKDYTFALDTIIDILAAALLLYGYSKGRRYFYIPFLVVTASFFWN